MKKSVFRIVGFIVLLSVVLCRVNNIFSFKYSDGISTLSHFYDLEKNSVDVLVLGSSHSFVNFNKCCAWHKVIYRPMRGAAFLYLVSEREEKRSGKSKKYGIFLQ